MRRWSCVGLFLVLLAPDQIRAQVAGTSQDGHECVLGGAPAENPLQPTIGGFATARAKIVPAGKRGQEAVLAFDRTSRRDERCIATLARPLKSGEHLRVIVSARLESGNHLQFGFGSDDGGQSVDGALLTGFVALLEKGKVACYDGSGYRVVRGIKHRPGEWQTYAIDYVVGSDQLLLTAGGNQTAVKTPFTAFGGPPQQINRVFLSTGANTAKGEMKGLRAYAVTEPAVLELPVFGTIRWTRHEVPFIKPGPRAGFSGAGFAAADGKLFLMGGFIPDGDGTPGKGSRTSQWTFSYDPETNHWDKLPDLPGRREYGSAASHDSRIYFLGGGTQGPFVPHADVYAMDISASKPKWSALPPMSVPRTHLATGIVGNNLIAVGGNEYDGTVKGYARSTLRDIAECLDLGAPEQGWRTMASIPGEPRGWSASAATQKRLYVFGGLTYAPHRHRLRETLAFAPGENSWTRLAPPPLPVSGWKGALYKDRYVILIGGTSEDARFAGYRWNAQPLVYDTETDRWMRFSRSTTPPGGVYNDPGVAIIGNRIYVAGGEGVAGSHDNTLLIGEIIEEKP